MTVLFVAANGGHLAQLVALAPRLGSLASEAVWVTPADAQSDTLLAGAERVVIPAVSERALWPIARLNVLAAGVFRTHRPQAVVSTGSGVALAFLPQAVARGIPSYYIESATFADGVSVTGRVLQRVPRVRLFTQHAHRATGRWRFGGSVFDGCTIRVGPNPRPIRRAVVTLGSDRWTFRPMVERVRALLPDDVEVLWQVGPTDVGGLGIAAVRYLPTDRLEAAMADADVVISHAGCGTTLTALRLGRRPVLVARDPARGEVVDGHQLAFARALDALGLAVGREVGTLRLGDLELAARTEVSWSAAPAFDLAAASTP